MRGCRGAEAKTQVGGTIIYYERSVLGPKGIVGVRECDARKTGCRDVEDVTRFSFHRRLRVNYTARGTMRSKVKG